MKTASENPISAPKESEMFEFNLLQLANYLYSHRWWIAIGTSLCVLLALVWVTLVKTPVYRASVIINIDLFAEERGGATNVSSPFFMQDQMVGNKIGIVEQYFDSREFRDFLTHTIALNEVPRAIRSDLIIVKNEMDREKIVANDEMAMWVISKTDLKGLSEKSRIDLTGAARNPGVAAAVANVGAYSIVEYNRLMLLQRLENLKTFLNTQTSGTKKELHGLEEQLVLLQKSAKILSPDEVRVRVNSLQVDQEAKLIEFDRQYASLNTLITETEADLVYFKKLMQENKPSSYLYIDQIQRRLEVLRYQKMQAEDAQRTERSPSAETAPAISSDIDGIIQELGQQLKSLDPVASSPWDYVKKIEGALFELKQKRAQARSEAAAQQGALARTNQQFIGLPESLKRMSEVKRNIDLTTSLYTALMARLQDTQIKEAAHSNDLIIVSSAEAPRAPSGLGRTKTMLLALVGGIILSCLPLFLRFVMLPTIRNIKDLTHLQVPILGAIGWFQPKGGRKLLLLTLKGPEQPLRILKTAPNSIEANALRFVRFQIEQSLAIRAYQTGQASKLLIVGSINPHEGRTFVAANLADLFAASGVRTCLIDIDFSKPDLADYFPGAVLEKSPISDLFPERCRYQLFKVNDNLMVLKPRAQRDTMSEVLETREFEAALSALEVIFELIVVDSPPIVGHMEPVIAAQYADAFLLVVNQRKTLRTQVEDTVRVLQSSLSIPIFGIMNFTFDEFSQPQRKDKTIERQQHKKQSSDSFKTAA